MPAKKDFNKLIQRVTNGLASRADTDALQSSVIDGQIVLTRGGRTIAAGKDISRSVIAVGNQIHFRLNESGLEVLSRNLFPAPPGLPPPLPSLLFIGRETEMKMLRDHLITARGRPCIVVRGWPGVGKSTIMSALGRDQRVLKHFPDGVLWTSLGQNPCVMSALASWGRALGTDAILHAPTAGGASHELLRVLGAKKILLLVDDVWDPEDLASFLAARGSNCVVVVTTREPRVALSLTSTPAIIHPLPILEEPYALDLFRAIAPEIAAQYPEQTRDLVKSLECLPLAIHVAARLLAAEARFGWGIEALLSGIRSGTAVLDAHSPEDRFDSGAIPTVAALLRKSTDRLSEEMREYFAYLGVFAPKPATFDLELLATAWQVSDPKPIVRELVSRGLLEPAPEGRFRMHTLLVAHARSLLR